MSLTNTIAVGDTILGFDLERGVIHTKVVFIHDHPKPTTVVALSLNDSTSTIYELTGEHRLFRSPIDEFLIAVFEFPGGHRVLLYTATDFHSKVHFREIAANEIREGDILLKKGVSTGHSVWKTGHSVWKTLTGWEFIQVHSISHKIRTVRYLLTESDTVLINGIASFTFSTSARIIETLPFKVLFGLSPRIVTNKAVGVSMQNFSVLPV